MNTLIETRSIANQLNEKVQKHIEELIQATDEAIKSEEMLRYLSFCARFHEYSVSNIWLILLNKPNATYVAGFHKWKSLGRWVRKGERGIPILAPILIKEVDGDGIENRHLAGFKVVYVFDVSQTEGEPLPPMPNWKSQEKNLELNQRLIQYANSQGIDVSFKNMPRDIQGMSMGGSIEIDLTAGTKTLIHELAHELMHRGKDNFQGRTIKELEAESVAYVVCRYFGVENLNSPNYLAFFIASSNNMLVHLDRIIKTSHDIIIAINSIT